VPASSRSLRRNRNFMIFWAGQTCSVLGDAFALIAIPLLVLNATGSLAKMGLVTAAFGAGSLVAGILAGPLVDRVDRRKLMICCDLGRAVVYGLIPLTWWLVGPQIWLIYAVTVVGAGLGMIFGVAYITAVANLVDRSQITEANGRLQATYAAAFALGPVLAGLISGQFGPTAAIGVDATTFLASAASLSAVRLRRAAAVRPPGELAGRKQEFLAGIRFLIEDPIFRWITFLLGALAFLATGATDLFIYYLRTNLGQGDRAVGVVFGIASIGAMLAGLFASRLRRRWGFGSLFIGGLLLQGISLAVAGLAPTVVVVVLITVAYTFAESIRGVVTMSLRQELTPDHLLGRVTAAFWTVFSVPGPLGAAAITAIGARAGAPRTLVVMGLLILALGALAARSPVRVRQPGQGRPDLDAPRPEPGAIPDGRPIAVDS